MCPERYDEDEEDVRDARLWLILIGGVVAVAGIAALVGFIALVIM